MLNSKIVLLLILSFLNIDILHAKIQIKYKIGDEIITNLDIKNEKEYLLFLRPNLNTLSNKELIKISENSLIQEVIKRKEITKLFENLDNENLNNQIKKRLFKFKNVSNEDEFLKLLNQTEIKYEKIIEKMKFEAFWNELIFQKYNSLIKIDEKRQKEELLKRMSENIKYEYNISELLFEVEKNEKLQKKYNEILEYIELNNFKTAATRYSISDSAKIGGQIGWVKETLLSENLNSLLKKLKIQEITKPIKYPSGYLLIKINNKKEMKQIVSIDKELKDLINYEKNKQLNQFSLLFYKKLKQNTTINAY